MESASKEEIETALRYYRRHLAQKKEKYDKEHPIESRRPRGRPCKVKNIVNEEKEPGEDKEKWILEQSSKGI